MASGKEAIEQFELQAGGLEGDEHVDLCLMNQPIHGLLIRIGNQ